MTRLLTVSKDELVLSTGKALLTASGYSVITTMDEREALSLATSVDGVVIGDSLPLALRISLAHKLAETCPNKPVIALLRVYEDGVIPEATKTVRNTPEELLGAVRETFPKMAV